MSTEILSPPTTRPASTNPSTFPQDLLASVVVFLVALPLCLGVAIASGMPPAAGIVTGILGGLVVGSFAGSPLQVSGPAAGLTVLVWDFLHPYAQRGEQTLGIGLLGLAVLVAGALQLTMGLARLGQWFRAVTPAVIHGMLAGIGLLIFASQFHVLVDDQPKGSGLHNLLYIPQAIYKGLFADRETTPHFWAACVGVASLAVIPLWKGLAPHRLRLVPAPLLAVAVGTVIAEVLDLPVARVAIPPLAEALSLPAFGALVGDGGLAVPTVLHVLGAGLVIALIASAETLLCATAVDQMHTGPRTRYDRELAAQGIGNMLCGLVCALPMTGVIVRSAANVEAGARSRLSTILHGCWLLLAALLLGGLLQRIPTAALAAVLVYTGYKLMDPKHLRELWSYGRYEAFVFLATFATIALKDLLTGVVVGLVLSIARLLYLFSHLSIRTVVEEANGRTIMYLEGAATFIRLPRLAAALEQIPPGAELHVNFEHLSFIDHACMDLLMNWEKQHEAVGGRLVIDWDSLTARFKSRGRRRHHHREAKQAS